MEDEGVEQSKGEEQVERDMSQFWQALVCDGGRALPCSCPSLRGPWGLAY